MGIKIIECGEPLIDVQAICPSIRIKSNETAYLRETVAKMLAHAQANLPKGYSFFIRSAWRSVKDQIETRKRMGKRFAQNHPTWTKQRLSKELGKFVAPHRGLHASGHLAGAAIDLGLYNNGRPVPLRCHQIAFHENAKPFHPKLPTYIQKNRQIMFDALIQTGLVNYPHEYWHWSYGDIEWAKITKNNTVIYGTISPNENLK